MLTGFLPVTSHAENAAGSVEGGCPYILFRQFIHCNSLFFHPMLKKRSWNAAVTLLAK